MVKWKTLVLCCLLTLTVFLSGEEPGDDIYKETVEDLINEGKLKLKLHSSNGITIAAPSSLHEMYLKQYNTDIETLMGNLSEILKIEDPDDAGRAVIKNVLERNRTYILLIDSDVKYFKFNKIMKAAARTNKGFGFEQPDKSENYSIGKYVTAVNISRMFDPVKRRAIISHAAGVMILRQIVEMKTPFFLEAGFGSYCEETVLSHPRVLADRWPPQKNQTWGMFIKANVKKIKYSKVHSASMKKLAKGIVPAIWSYTRFLIDQTGKFPILLIKLRNGERIEKVIESVYGFKGGVINQKWYAYVDSMPEGEFGETLPVWEQYSPYAPEEWHQKIETEVKSMMVKSGLKNLGYYSSKHMTLICSEENAKKYLPDLKKLEEKLEKIFSGVINDGLDPRSAYMVLLDKDTRKHLPELWDAFSPDLKEQAGGNMRELVMKSGGWRSSSLSVHDIEIIPDPSVREQLTKAVISYNLGFMYMNQLTQDLAPDFMQVGFGSYCEKLMYKTPLILSISYIPRDFDPYGKWENHIKNMIRLKKTVPFEQLFNSSTVNMPLDEYIQSWAAVTFLAIKPDLFESLINALGNKSKIRSALPAIYRVTLKKSYQEFLGFAKKLN